MNIEKKFALNEYTNDVIFPILSSDNRWTSSIRRYWQCRLRTGPHRARAQGPPQEMASAKVDIKKSLGCMSYYLSYFVSYVIITLFSTEINR